MKHDIVLHASTTAYSSSPCWNKHGAARKSRHD